MFVWNLLANVPHSGVQAARRGDGERRPFLLQPQLQTPPCGPFQSILHRRSSLKLQKLLTLRRLRDYPAYKYIKGAGEAFNDDLEPEDH